MKYRSNKLCVVYGGKHRGWILFSEQQFKHCIEQLDTGSSKRRKIIQEICVSESVEAILETCPH
jgi:hypothetical protein